jgi:hypothetical protein
MIYNIITEKMDDNFANLLYSLLIYYEARTLLELGVSVSISCNIITEKMDDNFANLLYSLLVIYIFSLKKMQRAEY